MKSKAFMSCTDCVHNYSKGCLLNIDKGISKKLNSKKGNHAGCFEKVSGIPVEILTSRRQKALLERVNNE